MADSRAPSMVFGCLWPMLVCRHWSYRCRELASVLGVKTKEESCNACATRNKWQERSSKSHYVRREEPGRFTRQLKHPLTPHFVGPCRPSVVWTHARDTCDALVALITVQRSRSVIISNIHLPHSRRRHQKRHQSYHVPLFAGRRF